MRLLDYLLGNDIHPLLHRPTADKYKQLSLGILLNARPLLRLPAELSPASLKRNINLNLLCLRSCLKFRRPVPCIGRIRIGQAANLGEAPEDRIPCKASLSVLLRDTNGAKSVLEFSQITGSRVQEVEDLAELDEALDNFLLQVEDTAHFFLLFLGAQAPHALELGVVKREAAWDDAG